MSNPAPHQINTRNRLSRAAAAVSVISASLIVLSGCESYRGDDTSRWSAEKLYAEAREESNNGNYERAGKLYERLEGRASGTVLAQQAELERAYISWKVGEKAQATTILERFVKLHPTSPALDYALYLQGLVNFNDNLGLLGSYAGQDLAERDQQASRDSFQSFRQLVDQFPGSIYADDARLRLEYIVNALAAYEVHVARYYYRRGAYVAAANRAQQTIQEFQRSPSTEEALYILVESYDKLGLATLRDDAARVLQTSFPNSEFGGIGLAPKKRSWWRLW